MIPDKKLLYTSNTVQSNYNFTLSCVIVLVNVLLSSDIAKLKAAYREKHNT